VSESTEVSLDGQKYVLRFDDDPTAVQAAAALVNQHMARIRATAKSSSPYQVALLTALNLALQLEKASHNVEAFKEQTIHELSKLEELVRQRVDEINAAQ
jgi:cell division protein ZapA (FtsZ GTPase activity inhibitor)